MIFAVVFDILEMGGWIGEEVPPSILNFAHPNGLSDMAHDPLLQLKPFIPGHLYHAQVT